MKEIIELYKERYPFQDFYPKAYSLIKNNKFISNVLFETDNFEFKNEQIDTTNGDIRVDLPIQIGNLNAKNRILFLGLEPRDTDKKYNIEKNQKFVFGTPFGIEFWNDKNKYYKTFKKTIENGDNFCYFTDVVKSYEVKKTKGEADKYARKNFWKKAAENDNIDFLNKEISILNPTLIIGLGNDSFNFLNNHFGKKFNVKKVIHPAAHPQNGKNAFEIASQKLCEIIN